jgi:hypothetical protein
MSALSTRSSKIVTASLVMASTVLAGAAVWKSPAVAMATPQPAIVSESWQLDFEYSIPRRITVELPGSSVPKAYWYITYVATNNTGSEQNFFPVIEIVDKNGVVSLANRNLSPTVFTRITEKERGKPLVNPLQIAGPILQGEDQAKYGVAVWEETDPRPGTFNVFVAGLSGEISTLLDSEGKPVKDAQGSDIKLRKTKSLEFTVRGDELYAGDPVVAGPATWVMR